MRWRMLDTWYSEWLFGAAVSRVWSIETLNQSVTVNRFLTMAPLINLLLSPGDIIPNTHSGQKQLENFKTRFILFETTNIPLSTKEGEWKMQLSKALC